jgi:glucose-6-phosphate isomerase
VRERALTVEAEIPASLTGRVREALALAAQAGVARRLRDGDATLWAPAGTPEVADRLGWLTIAERMLAQLDAVEAFAARAREDGVRDVVLLGMGGSSLAPEVLRRSFGHREGWPRLQVLDSTDAQRIRAVQDSVDLASTLFLVSSKSGGTIEPLSLFAHFWSLRADGKAFAAITDPGSGLEALAREHGFREVFAGDPDIGGRYSALSAFGVVPAALMGIDVRSLLAGAPGAWETDLIETGAGDASGAASSASTAGASGAGDASESAAAEAEQRAGVWLGAALAALARGGRDKLTFVISPSLPGLGLWLEQLVAESTGKQGTGILPVAEEPLGEPGAYGGDRVFACLPDVDAPDGELDARARELAQAGHPLITIPTRGAGDLGRVFLLAEIAVAVAGWGLRINPFDQPNVQQAKDATNRVLAGYEASGALPAVADAELAAVRALLADGAPPQYVALMAYAEPSAELDEAVAGLRVAIRAASGATTTFGYGPRFLHSTGQFHKGGPRTGRFLQLIHDGPQDVAIPGAAYTFTTLKNAQAIGDLQTLRELGLPAERVRLAQEDPVGAVRALTATIKEQT